MAKKSETQSIVNIYYPWLLAGGSLIGLIAATILTYDKMELLAHPAARLSCDLNPVVACGSVIITPQASAFGFPNPFLGIAGFAMALTVGVAMLAGAKFKRWFWLSFFAGTVFGIGFIHWLFFQSVYRINALCPYCMVVWAVTIPIFVYTIVWNVRAGNIKTPKRLKKICCFINTNHFGIVILWYLAIAAAIVHHFWYFFGK